MHGADGQTDRLTGCDSYCGAGPREGCVIRTIRALWTFSANKYTGKWRVKAASEVDREHGYVIQCSLFLRTLLQVMSESRVAQY